MLMAGVRDVYVFTFPSVFPLGYVSQQCYHGINDPSGG